MNLWAFITAVWPLIVLAIFSFAGIAFFIVGLLHTWYDYRPFTAADEIKWPAFDKIFKQAAQRFAKQYAKAISTSQQLLRTIK